MLVSSATRLFDVVLKATMVPSDDGDTSPENPLPLPPGTTWAMLIRVVSSLAALPAAASERIASRDTAPTTSNRRPRASPRPPINALDTSGQP
jgi:hypothetical protein